MAGIYILTIDLGNCTTFGTKLAHIARPAPTNVIAVTAKSFVLSLFIVWQPRNIILFVTEMGWDLATALQRDYGRCVPKTHIQNPDRAK